MGDLVGSGHGVVALALRLVGITNGQLTSTSRFTEAIWSSGNPERPIHGSVAKPPPTPVNTLCRPNHEPSFSSGSQNFQPFGGGGRFAGAFQPSGGVQPGSGAGNWAVGRTSAFSSPRLPMPCNPGPYLHESSVWISYSWWFVTL
jgi:hypothetical protein